MIDLKKECSKTLIALEKNVIAADRTDAMTVLNFSRPTIDNYLAGKVNKIDVAFKIIEFMSKRVNDRIKFLKQAAAA